MQKQSTQYTQYTKLEKNLLWNCGKGIMKVTKLVLVYSLGRKTYNLKLTEDEKSFS